MIADNTSPAFAQSSNPPITVEPTHVAPLGTVRLTRNDLPLRFYVRMLAEKAHLQRSLMRMANARTKHPEQE